MGAAMGVEWMFVRVTGALQVALPVGASAQVAARVGFLDHATLVIAIVLGTMIGLMSGFAGPMCTRVRASLVMFAWIPVPMVAALTVGLAVGGYEVAAVVGMAVIFALGTYARRFGPRGFLGGILGFMGYFLGFFLRAHAGITLTSLGWLAAEIAVGAAVATVVQLTVFFPARRAAARRTSRSYRARVGQVARLCVVLLGGPPTARARARLHRRVDHLGEAALILDARLAELATSVSGWPDPATARRLLAEHEGAMVELARAVERLADQAPSETACELTFQALDAVIRRDPAGLEHAAGLLFTAGGLETVGDAGGGGLAHIAAAVDRLVVASRSWTLGETALSPRTRAHAEEGDDSSVALFGGWLPGSTLIARAASQQQAPRGGYWGGLRVSPHLRASIQMAVAGGVAIGMGYLVSGYRFYWAGLAAFFILVGTNTTGEQVRKSIYRVAGTVVGVVIAFPIVHLAGDRPGPVIAVVLAALFLGLYLIRINYALMIVGVTVAVAELYVESGEFTGGLLLLRLVETVIGAAVVSVTVMVVLPLRPARVTGHAIHEYLDALIDLASRSDAPTRPDGPGQVDARRIDVAYQTLLATSEARYIPYGRLTDGRNQPRLLLLHAAATAHDQARTLLACDEAAGPHARMQAQQDLRGAITTLTEVSIPCTKAGSRDTGHPRHRAVAETPRGT